MTIAAIRTDTRWPLCLALVTLLPALGGWEALRSRINAVESGNAKMKAGKAEEALGDYDKAVADAPAEPGVHFDRGTALSALSRFDEAAQEFLRATEAKDTSLKAEAFYNLGNAYFKKDKFKEAGEAYKRAMTLDPHHQHAKWNAELALKKQREEEKKKQDQKDKNKDNKDNKDKSDKKDDKSDKKQDDKKDEDKKDDKKEDKKQDEQKKDDKKQDEQKDQKDPAPPPEPKSADQREMESALDGLDKSPKDLEKQRAMMRAVRRAPPTRDW